MESVMETHKEPETTEQRSKQDRAGLIPLADRRKLLRQDETPSETGQIITDWVSL